MRVHSTFGKMSIRDFPSIKDIERFFVSYKEDEWSVGGASGADIVIYGAHGTEDGTPFKDRVDIWITIYDHPEYGMCTQYTKGGGGYRDNYFSLGDVGRLSKVMHTRHGDPLPVGLFVSPTTAWIAVKHFIETRGDRSPDIDWISADDVPREAFPES